MSSINFNSTPNNVRVPFMMAEFDSSQAVSGAQNQPYRALLIGQKLPSGKADFGKPLRLTKKEDAEDLFGISSMLAEMAESYLAVDKITELWAIALPDAAAGLHATGTVTFSGLASLPGTLYLYIAGYRITESIVSGAEPAAIAEQVADTVNNIVDMPITAEADGDAVKLTAKHPGEAGNHIDVRFNYYTGETLPTGISVEITPFAGGAVNPDAADAVAAVYGEWFNAFISAYTDEPNLRVITEDLARRWGPMVMQEGWLFASVRGAFGELCAFGNDRNSLHQCIPHCHGIPESPWRFAASVAACAMYYGNMDQARPFQTLTLVGIHAPAVEDRFSDFPESNQLLYSGISTFYVDANNDVKIGRLITTYKKDARGADDTAYLDLNTGLTLAYLRWDWRNHMLRTYPRHKLADDTIHFKSGQAIVTPLRAKAECIVKLRDWEERGLVENVDELKKEIVVERNTADRNRLDFLIKPDLVNQFIVGAAQIQFYL